MQKSTQKFINKKILIYGLGKSGISSFKFLKEKNLCFIYDDNFNNYSSKIENYVVDKKKIIAIEVDFIVLSPGIDIRKCTLSKYLKKNKKKIITDFDIFYNSFPFTKKITITGTNGKSTTSKLLFDILKKHNIDVRLVGNIGNPILSEKKIKDKTVFVIEASSYQLEYSKLFKTDYAVILNLSPDHIERHLNFKNYIKAKFKLVKNQNKNSIALLENKNNYLKKLIKKNKIQSKINFINNKKNLNKLVTNKYFTDSSSIENLNFIFKISNLLGLDKFKVIKVINKFKPLKFRKQIILNNKKYLIINDSKSTSFSSSVSLLQKYENVYWILGGLSKKNDKFLLEKKFYKNINAFIYGKDKLILKKKLINKINVIVSDKLKDSIKLVFKNTQKSHKKRKVILFSPAAASFDQFKNFEERGLYFNKLIKKFIK